MLEQNPETTEPPTTGLSHWLRRRQEWTRNHIPVHENTERTYHTTCPHLADVEPAHYDAIYASLTSGRRFAQRVPLEFVVDLLWYGWKKVYYLPFLHYEIFV